MSSNDRRSTLALKHSISVLSHEKHALTEAMKARQKCPVAGPTTGCWTTQDTCIEERSESESELDNQLSGILRKANKQTCILVCLCMYVCMRRESESASHSSPPQLKGVRVISACARARVCAGTISLISLLCLFVCRCTP